MTLDLKITPQMLGAIEIGDRTPSLYLEKNLAFSPRSFINDSSIHYRGLHFLTFTKRNIF